METYRKFRYALYILLGLFLMVSEADWRVWLIFAFVGLIEIVNLFASGETS